MVLPGTEDGQLGPGFFIFFRQPGGSKVNKPVDRFKRIRIEDEEILLFIKTIVSKGLI